MFEFVFFKKEYLIFSLVLVSLIFFIPQTSYGLISDGINIEVGVEFDYPKNINSLRVDYKNNLAPELETTITNFGSDFSNFSFGVLDQKSYCNLLLSPITKKLNEDNKCHLDNSLIPKTNWIDAIIVSKVDTIYHVDLNLVMFGTNSTMTETEFNTEYNTMIALLRITIMTFLIDNNASNVSSEISFTHGKYNFNEGF